MKKILIYLLISIFVLGSCGVSTSNVEWGYGAENGPDEWANLSDDYQLCGNGEMQSPINIETSEMPTAEQDLEFTYESTIFEVVDTGHSIEFLDENEQNSLEYNGDTYNLEQIHFHNGSENLIDNTEFDLEGHLVHTNDAGENLVVSVMFSIGEENSAIADGFAKVSQEIVFDPKDLIPSDSEYYSFLGSLTTPPCTENVRWLVFDEPLSVSQEQYDAFTNVYRDNNRDVEDLNDREIKEGSM